MEEEIKEYQNTLYAIALCGADTIQYVDYINIKKDVDDKGNGVTLAMSYTTPGKNIIKLIMNKNVLFFDKKSEAEHILDIIKDVYGNDTNFKVVKLNITCNCTFV